MTFRRCKKPHPTFGCPIDVPGPWEARLQIAQIRTSIKRGTVAFFQLDYGGVKLTSGGLIEDQDRCRFLVGPNVRTRIFGRWVLIYYWILPADMRAAVLGLIEGALAAGAEKGPEA